MSHKLSPNSMHKLGASGHSIPSLGFGVYQSDGEQGLNAIIKAFEDGYRHIDSAQLYENEREVGIAMDKSGLPRSEMYITSKIATPSKDLDSTVQLILDSVEKIDPRPDGYIDLFLMHGPDDGPEAVELCWKAMEIVYGQGKLKAIGVSNFGRSHLDELKGYAKVWPPHANQIELHPWCQQQPTIAHCDKLGIPIEAYCPLVRGQKQADPTLNEIAKKYGKSQGQILIRWSLQRGFIPLPKSVTPSRITENISIYDFEISADDMKRLDGLDEGKKGSIFDSWCGDE